jgi:hypothetical protein
LHSHALDDLLIRSAVQANGHVQKSLPDKKKVVQYSLSHIPDYIVHNVHSGLLGIVKHSHSMLCVARRLGSGILSQQCTCTCLPIVKTPACSITRTRAQCYSHQHERDVKQQHCMVVVTHKPFAQYIRAWSPQQTTSTNWTYA